MTERCQWQYNILVISQFAPPHLENFIRKTMHFLTYLRYDLLFSEQMGIFILPMEINE